MKWSLQLPGLILERRQFTLQFYFFSPWIGMLTSHIFPYWQKNTFRNRRTIKEKESGGLAVLIEKNLSWKIKEAWPFNYEYVNFIQYFILLDTIIWSLLKQANSYLVPPCRICLKKKNCIEGKKDSLHETIFPVPWTDAFICLHIHRMCMLYDGEEIFKFKPKLSLRMNIDYRRQSLLLGCT